MSTDYDAIASIVLDEFKRLPAKRKPCVRDNGLHEWVPLSGIVAKGPEWLKCVALATGMKCLPAAKLPQANGTAIHDWHAEILAIRAFNHFVVEECKRLASSDDGDKTSGFIRRRTADELVHSEINDDDIDGEDFWHGQPFTWREDVTLHMYCSEAPCGDASMELIMAAQEDASPWDLPSSLPANNNMGAASSPTSTPLDSAPQQGKDPTESVALSGRGYFSQLGIVRRKPSRGDAPQSLSKSCSDKIALKQCTSLLSSLASLFVSPSSAYITSLILPESQYSPTGCQRCFSAASSPLSNPEGADPQQGRMKPLLPYRRNSHDSASPAAETPISRCWKSSGYAFAPFTIHTTSLEFDFSKRTAAAGGTNPPQPPKTDAGSTPSIVASNLAVAWTANGLNEGLIGGVHQGRKKFDIKGASAVSRRKMWKLATEVAEKLDANRMETTLTKALTAVGVTYDEVKESRLLRGRRLVKEEARKEALKGWVRNTGDGAFSLSDI